MVLFPEAPGPSTHTRYPPSSRRCFSNSASVDVYLELRTHVSSRGRSALHVLNRPAQKVSAVPRLRFDHQIAGLCPQLPDYDLFRRLPGAGPALAPRLLVAFGERRERFPNAAALQKYAGVAPVTERSGNKSWVHWRYGCSKFLRQTFVEWAAQTIPRSFWAKAYYDSCRARGTRHQAALRALAFKWIRILYRCWVTRTPYDESRYLMALRKRSAPLLKHAAQTSS